MIESAESVTYSRTEIDSDSFDKVFPFKYIPISSAPIIIIHISMCCFFSLWELYWLYAVIIHVEFWDSTLIVAMVQKIMFKNSAEIMRFLTENVTHALFAGCYATGSDFEIWTKYNHRHHYSYVAILE